MLHKLRERAQEERGFTLIELLVVILIIGILAAIAIPSFLSQTSKAYDASAKELARTAETTADTYGTDNGNYFTLLTSQVLNTYEGTIPTSSATAGNNAWLLATTGLGTTYVVTAESYSQMDKYSIVYQNGLITRYCGGPAWTPPTASNASTFNATATTAAGCVHGSW
jgi:type IV pilus assembly protein PilA